MQLYNADCLEILPTLADNTYHSLVTDPPAGIDFMGLAFDSDRGGKREWIAWLSSVMKECLRVLRPGAHALVWALPRTSHWTADAIEDAGFEIRDVIHAVNCQGFPKSKACLKPAYENWILARKRLSETSIAANVLKWGTGALNIDDSRIGSRADKPQRQRQKPAKATCYGDIHLLGDKVYSLGRWPANFIVEGDELPEWARYFKVNKASRAERDAGCEHLPAKASGYRPNDPDENTIRQRLHGSIPACNNHPTVKPLAVMRYLCKLITPVGGTVLDPFMGSGSTGIAALEEGFDFVGIEKEEGYFQIANARMNAPVLNG